MGVVLLRVRLCGLVERLAFGFVDCVVPWRVAWGLRWWGLSVGGLHDGLFLSFFTWIFFEAGICRSGGLLGLLFFIRKDKSSF